MVRDQTDKLRKKKGKLGGFLSRIYIVFVFFWKPGLSL